MTRKSARPVTPPRRPGVEIDRLRRRSDFLRAAKGKRWHGKAVSLQAVRRSLEADDGPPRVGFTLTRKVGCAVVRNRARRRLRAALRLAEDLPARVGHDYVVIGRIEAIRLPFEALEGELARAFVHVHDAGRPKRGVDAETQSRKTRPATPSDENGSP